MMETLFRTLSTVKPGERNQAPSCVRLEQLRERQKELEEARLQLE
jgi:hypothetical protein